MKYIGLILTFEYLFLYSLMENLTHSKWEAIVLVCHCYYNKLTSLMAPEVRSAEWFLNGLT